MALGTSSQDGRPWGRWKPFDFCIADLNHSQPKSTFSRALLRLQDPALGPLPCGVMLKATTA